MEESAEELKDRCQRLYKGCKKFTEALGVACSGDSAFADALEAFGGGQDDPVSVSIGGPVISKFINAFRELATYKELLRSQVEHVLIDRLTEFLTVDLHDAKDLQNSKSAFEKSCINLVSALTNIEAKKKYEFLESISAIMDVHLRYFKLGYDLLSKIEPYVHQENLHPYEVSGDDEEEGVDGEAIMRLKSEF